MKNKTKWGGQKDGIGLYDIMVAPLGVYEKIVDAIDEGNNKTALTLLDLNVPEGVKNVL